MIWKKVFPFTIDPGIYVPMNIFSLSNLPDETILNQWEGFDSGLPND
jgi:hypothetical protein